MKEAQKYVSFGDIAREQMDMQCQYAVRYLFPNQDRPYLGEAIRTTGTIMEYHGVKIHRDDIAEFLRRFQAYKIENHLV